MTIVTYWAQFARLAQLWLLFCVLATSGCEALIGADFGQRYVVGQAVDGGEIVAPGVCVPASCASEGFECGTFVDECTGQTFQCGTCATNKQCEDNRCVCPEQTCEGANRECGYLVDSCNRSQFCQFCEDTYPGDPTRAYCSEGQCGADPCQAGSCQELQERGIAAECGSVAVCETSVDCGACPGRELCLDNTCDGYNPLRCGDVTGGGLLCGTFANGAGGEITCGCDGGEVCAKGGVCCAPRECPDNACGTLPDGCGGTIECGGCGDGAACLDNVCCDDNPTCPDNSCGQVTSCGQVIDCTCGEGSCCNVEQGTARCHVAACPTDGSCGDGLPDGCGGTVDGCGCPDGHACVDGRCECQPRECPNDGSCGYVSDGCDAQILCECGQGDRCIEGECCSPTCPEGACGMVADGCGGLIECTCPAGEGCSDDGRCLTVDCPDNASCGVVVELGEALACRGLCPEGQPCELREDGNFVCGNCSAQCPDDATCGLTDLECTVLSCPGSCGVDGQQCVNRAVGDGPDNYTCCTPRCPTAETAVCGAFVDTACGGAALS